MHIRRARLLEATQNLGVDGRQPLAERRRLTPAAEAEQND